MDFYAYGIYLDDCQGTLVEGNDVTRANRISVGSFYGISLTGGNLDNTISKNRIHNTHDNASSTTGSWKYALKHKT